MSFRIASEFYHAKLAACDQQIEAHLGTFADHRHGKSLQVKPRQRSRRAHEPHFDARDLLHRMSGVDLTVMEGIDATTALTILSAIGLDLSRFPSLKHCCSWLGLCPPHQISAGKIKSRHIRPGANWVAQALRLAARSLPHAKTALGGFFRRMKSRMGAAQAITATAHKLARLVYTLLKHGTEYVQQGLQEYEARYRDRDVRNVAREARELSFELVPAPHCEPDPRPCPPTLGIAVLHGRPRRVHHTTHGAERLLGERGGLPSGSLETPPSSSAAS